jgi:virginiamycin B lyase
MRIQGRYFLDLTAVVITLLTAGGVLFANRAVAETRDGDAYTLSGSVRGIDGVHLPGVMVTAAGSDGIAITVYTDSEGRFEISSLEPGQYRMTAWLAGFEAATIEAVAVGSVSSTDPIEFALTPVSNPWITASSNLLLALLPDGEDKRRFILDCTGCHQIDQVTIGIGESARTHDQWEESVGKMLSFAGSETMFPIISASRDAAATAHWLTAGLDPARESDTLAGLTEQARRASSAHRPEAVITEYDFPEAADLPHDLAVNDGRVIVTGMFSGAMYVLDPANGEFERVPIPVAQANPRAVDIDDHGNWLVALGAPRSLARYSPSTGEWETWSLGMYPHSIMPDGNGKVWFNGHFSRDPERIGSLDPTTGVVESFDVPGGPMADGSRTIQYGLRVGPDGAVWTTQLAGGALIRYSPRYGDWLIYDLPTPFSGPRRPDLDADGAVWIPEYANNRLARFDPTAEQFTEYPLPIPDALPYVVRVDRRRNRVWIGTAAADAMLLFEPESERFSLFPLPTRGALIRHIDIDEESGDVWIAYGASPSRAPARIARLTLP